MYTLHSTVPGSERASKRRLLLRCTLCLHMLDVALLLFELSSRAFTSFETQCLSSCRYSRYEWNPKATQINGYGSANIATRKELQKRSSDFLVDGALHVRVAIQVEAAPQVPVNPRAHFLHSIMACLSRCWGHMLHGRPVAGWWRCSEGGAERSSFVTAPACPSLDGQKPRSHKHSVQ